MKWHDVTPCEVSASVDDDVADHEWLARNDSKRAGAANATFQWKF